MADVEIRFGADTAELQAALQKAEQSLQNLSGRVQAQTGELGKMSAATRDILGQYDKAPSTLKRAQDNFQGISEALNNNEISAEQAIKALNGLSTQADRAGRSLGHAGGQAGIFREKMVLLHEALTGSTTRLAGSMLVLTERTGSVEGAFRTLLTPTTLAIGAVAAFGGAIVASMVNAERAATILGQVNNVLLASGDASRLSASQISGAVKELQHLPDVTREMADNVVLALSRTRQVSGPAFNEIIGLVGKFSQVMGVDAVASATTLASVMADPEAAMKRLEGTALAVSSATYSQVEAALKQNDTARASSLIMAELSARLANVKDHGVTPLAESVNALKSAWDNFTNSPGLKSVGQWFSDESTRTLNSWAALLGDAKAQEAQLVDMIGQQKQRIADVQAQIARGETPAHPLENYIRRLDELEERLRTVRSEQAAAESIHTPSGIATQPGAQQAGAPAQGQTPFNNTALDDAAKKADQESEGLKTIARQRADLQDQINAKKGLESQLNERILEAEEGSLKVDQQTLDAWKQQVANIADSVTELERRRDALKDPGGESNMERWKRELAEQQAGDARSLEERKAADLAFWQSKLANLQKGSKDFAQVYAEMSRLQKEIDKQNLADVLANMEEQREAAQRGSQERIAIARAEAELLKNTPGVSDKQISDANKRIEEMEREHVQTMRQIDEEQANNARVLADDILAREQANLAFRASMGQISANEELAGQRELAEAKYEIDRKALEDKLSLNGVELVEQQKLNDQLMQLDSKHETDMERLDQQAAQNRLKSLQSAVQPFQTATDQMVSGYLQGTLTMSQAAARGAQSIAISYINAAAHWAEDWFEKHVLMAAWDSAFAAKEVATTTAAEASKTAATTSGNAARAASDASGQAGFFSRVASQVAEWLGFETAKTGETVAGNATRTTSDVATTTASIASAKLAAATIIPAETAIAAMGAASSVASIPYVGPALATAAASEMTALGATYLAIASAYGGEEEVPHDGAHYRLHKRESVLPESFSVPLRGLLRRAAASQDTAFNNLGGGGGGSTNHFHLQSSQVVNHSGPMSRADAQDFFRRHGDLMMGHLQNAVRNGKLRT